MELGIFQPTLTGVSAAALFSYSNRLQPRLNAQTPVITYMNVTQEPRNIDAVVALFRLSSSENQPQSRLQPAEVTLEILSELFSFQEKAEVTVSAILQNGRRIVIDDPSEIRIASSNTSIVSVVNNFVAAEGTGSAELTVSWVVCGAILGTAVIPISVQFDQHRPIFEDDEQTSNIPEDTMLGASITNVFANDLDYLPSVDLSVRDTEYSFSDESSSHGGLFVLNKTSGVITLNGPLDRETISAYVLRVEATDRFQRRAQQQFLNSQSEGGTGSNGEVDGSGSGILAPIGSGSGSGNILIPATSSPPSTTTPTPLPRVFIDIIIVSA